MKKSLGLLNSLLLLLTANACLGGSRAPLNAGQSDGGAIADAGTVGLCRGPNPYELIVNEYLVRPAGIDVDGDGESNALDEAIELTLPADASPVSLVGGELWVGLQRHGTIIDGECLRAGGLFVLTSSQAMPLQVYEGATVIHLDHLLKLPDAGGHFEFRGRDGAVWAHVTFPKQNSGPVTSFTRVIDGDAATPFVAHATLPKANGALSSFGLCNTGDVACGCLASQGMDCAPLSAQ